MNDYPLPSHCVALWTAGETLWVRFPPTQGHDRGHVVALHASVEGLKNLLVILRQREASPNPKIGQPGSPTQYDLETIAKALASQRRAKPALTLDDLELDL